MDPLLASVRLNRAAVQIQAVFRGKRARSRHLEFLLNEVLQTERAYVQDLTKAIEHYFKPLRELALGPQRDRLIDADGVAAIFGNLEDVLVIAEELLARITKEIEGGGCNLGEIFTSHAFALKLYARYVSNYEQATERLHVAEKNKKFVAWLRERRLALEATTERGKLGSRCCDLRNLLIKPVQRIPRYELLLKELVRVKARVGQNDPALDEAVRKLMDVGQHNNDVIFHTQNREALYAVQKKFGNASIIGEGRVLLRDGPVMKICRKDHKPYRLVLFSDQLLTVTENGSKYRLHHRIMLADPATSASIQPVARLGDTALRIESSLKSFICYCDTVPETKEWADALGCAIDDCRREIDQRGAGDGAGSSNDMAPRVGQGGNTPRTTSVARPVWVQDTEITACMLCRKNFTARTPLSTTVVRMRRHHCRICGALVCGSCSPHRVIRGVGSQADLRADKDTGRPERVCKKCKQVEVEHGSFSKAYLATKHEIGLSAAGVAQSTAPIFAGYLEKKGSAQGTFGRRNWKRRWFTLTADHKLSYYETTQHSDPLGTLDLALQTLVVLPDRRGFMLRSATRDFQIRTEVGDNTHYQQWISHLTRAVAAAKGEELPTADDNGDELGQVEEIKSIHRVFRDDEPVGIVLVELDTDDGGFLVAVESLLEGGQAERQEQELNRENQQASEGAQPQCMKPGLVLVEINDQSVQGWRYADVVPLLAARPLGLRFREDAVCEQMLKALPPLANVNSVASPRAISRDDTDSSEATAAGTEDLATTERVSLWQASLSGAAVGTTTSGDHAPLVLVLLARMLRQNDQEFFSSVEIFAREPNCTLASDLKHCLCTVTTEDELLQAIGSDENETLARAAGDPYVLSKMFLQFLREWPGGILRDIDHEALLDCDSEDSALELLGGLAETEQDIMNVTIALLVEVGEQQETNQMGHGELAVQLAAALTSCVTIPTESSYSASAPTAELGSGTGLVLRLELDSESVEVFIFILMDFWADNIR